ncbi:uncharacterized protein M6B38_189160 [Iris pallida]|uniref:CCR4-NOT transcription complex subunit 4 n=1 Tax=Iris pallida TaxID=29817 RepID=A0AAX6EHW1_IRIPA|nr:uncharacterized protein M6B38_189160 [Iris pallida]
MSDDGDRTCPLCAEEMDLTDQQLKPCKCGYEICVWCWHHIMDMAEKDGTEGRCPACRTTYDKDRIVATAANCGRMVAEVKTGKKQKSQKTKVKTSAEARKHLTGVRVVQRNLVYIIGLPINLSDESLLERKEYFGQYGKVVKVSISRLTGATAHHASNSNTFNVYITYSREEEAVRCIQAVHNFVLEGTTLSACFGTTKYCHAWLRNLTCGNPDCLYLHDVGNQEESFTKDEIISVYTRSRVLQISSTNLQRCSGNVLPPPIDDFSTCVTSNKTIPKSAANNAVSHVKASNYYAGKSTTDLPAAASWGSRASNCQSPVGSITCTQTSIKQKDESADSPSVHSSAIAPKQASQFHDEDGIASSVSEGNHEVQTNRLSRLPGPLKSGVSRVVSDTSSDSLQVEACVAGPSAWDDDIPIASSVPEERYTVHMSGVRPVKPAESSAVGEFLISRVDASSMTPSNANSSSVISTNCSSIHSTSVHGNNGNMVHTNGARTTEHARSNDVGDIEISGLDAVSRMSSYASPSSLISVSCSAINLASAPGMETGVVFPGSNGNLVNGSHDILDRQCISFRPDEAPCNRTDDNGSIQALCSSMSSLNTDGHLMVDHPDHNEHLVSTTNFSSADMAKHLASSFEQCSSENRFEDLCTVPCNQSSVLSSRHASRGSSNWSSETQNQVHSSGNKTKGPLSTDDDKIHRISHVSNGASYSSYLNYPLNVASYINSFDSDVRQEASSFNADSQTTYVGRDMLQLRENSTLFTEHNSLSNFCKSRNISELPQNKLNTEKDKSSSRYDVEANFDRSTSLDVPESSIISDILSLDFDPWDHALSSANDFAKLLGRTNKEDGSLFSTSRNSSIISQSRFSFARQDNQLNHSGSFREHPDTHKSFSLLHNSYGDNHPNGNGFSKSPCAVSRDPVVSSVGQAGLSRAKISAPPGFSSKNKAPPPGFSFQDKSEQTYAPAYSENILHTSLGNQYQVQESHTVADVEFIDPAILAVGRGCMPLGVNNSSTMGPSLPSQFISKSDSRLQLLMQQSASCQQQNRIISDHMGDMTLPPNNDPYSVPRVLPQGFSTQSPLAHFSLQQPINSLTSSNHLGGWNDAHAFNEVDNRLNMLRNERSGLNRNYYPRNDDYKLFHVPTADLYNRSFGM